MGGLRWRYCGYNSKAKAHLIEMTDESSYSGELLFDDTGTLVRAGHTVLSSPGETELLAIEQEVGVDGENWTIYYADGKPVWRGYAGIIAKVNWIDSVISTFDHPQWNKQGKLTARFVCSSSTTRGVVTLTRSSSGASSWHGHGKCSN